MHDRISVGQEYSTTSSRHLAKKFPLKKSIKSEFYHCVHCPFLVCTIGNTVHSYSLVLDQTALHRPVHTSPTMRIMMPNNARCVRPHWMCIRVMRDHSKPPPLVVQFALLLSAHAFSLALVGVFVNANCFLYMWTETTRIIMRSVRLHFDAY